MIPALVGLGIVVLVVLFVGITLTLGRWLIDKILPVLQAHTSWPGGVIGFIFTLTYLGFHEIVYRRNVPIDLLIGVSILDLLFHLGPDARSFIRPSPERQQTVAN